MVSSLGWIGWLAGLGIVGWATVSTAQVQPDPSLGLERSQLIPGSTLQGLPATWVNGGAQRGGNLFHSFLEFNVPMGERLYFANPVNVSHIFTRVVGGQPSVIGGTLGVNGSAHLYLLNPSGVAFTETAQLDIPGSFTVSTAEAWAFADGSQYRAVAGVPAPLTISVPLGLQRGASNEPSTGALNGVPTQGILRNQGTLMGSPGQDITFLGQRIEQWGTIAAPGGQVNLVGERVILGNPASEVASPGGAVALNAPFGADLFADPGRMALQATEDIEINDDVFIVIPGLGFTAEAGRDIFLNASIQAAGGGDLQFLAGRDITFSGANAYAWSYGGDVDLRAGGTITLLNGAQVDTSPFFGNSGDLTVTAQNLTMANGAQLKTGPYSSGTGGNLVVTVTDTVDLSGIGTPAFGSLGSTGLVANSLFPDSTGRSGTVEVNAPTVRLSDGAAIISQNTNDQPAGTVTITATNGIYLQGVATSPTREFHSRISASSDSRGNAGQVILRTGELVVEGGAFVAASNSGVLGEGGLVDITATNGIYLQGVATSLTRESRSHISASSDSRGNAGQVILRTGELVVEGGAFVEASNSGVLGGGGLVDIVAPRIRLDGQSPDGNPSGLLSRSFVFADAGTINLESTSITLTNGAEIDISALGLGGSSELTINTTDLTVDSGSRIAASSILGDAGEFTITALGLVTVSDGGNITADILADGQGATINLTAQRLRLDRGFVSADTFGSGNGGSITIRTTDTVEVTGFGSISTSTLIGTGNGGSLTITAPRLLIDGGSVESSSLSSGTGGNVVLAVGDLQVLNSGEVAVNGVLPTSGTGNIVIRAGTLFLDNRGRIIASAPASDGGNIDITATQRLLMRRSALISANAGDSQGLVTPPPGTGDGGNVSITAPFVIGGRGENSDIVATASLGNGGRVTIATRGLFGLEFRDRRTPLSDITASSEFGLSGVVEINALDTTALENSLADLPDLPLTTEGLVAGSCLARLPDNQGQFVVTGAGGLPTQPGSGVVQFSTGSVRGVEERLGVSSDNVPGTDSAASPAATSPRPTPENSVTPIWQPGDPIIEPTGIYAAEDHRWVLVHTCS